MVFFWGKCDLFGNLTSPVIFPKIHSTERVKPCFFVTFDIILSHIFPENLIEISQVSQKI